MSRRVRRGGGRPRGSRAGFRHRTRAARSTPSPAPTSHLVYGPAQVLNLASLLLLPRSAALEPGIHPGIVQSPSAATQRAAGWQWYDSARTMHGWQHFRAMWLRSQVDAMSDARPRSTSMVISFLQGMAQWLHDAGGPLSRTFRKSLLGRRNWPREGCSPGSVFPVPLVLKSELKHMVPPAHRPSSSRWPRTGN